MDPSAVLETAAQDAVVTLASAAQVADDLVIPDSYIVAFRAEPGAASRRYSSFRAEYRAHAQYLEETALNDPRVRGVNYITTVDLTDPGTVDSPADFASTGPLRLAWNEGALDELAAAIAKVDFASADGAASLLGEWEASGAIWYAEPNYTNRLLDNPYTKEVVDAYSAAEIWWHKEIKLAEALAKLAAMNTTNVSAPIVAVLDSGVDTLNPRIKDRIWQNSRPGDSGCPDDLNGCDTTDAHKGVLGSGKVHPYLTNAAGENCPNVEGEKGTCGHGTHVAGIITSNLGGGVGGVCPVCRIMVIKIIKGINGKGLASDDAILNGFKYLTLFGSSQKVVRVANSSFGKYVRSRSVALLVSVLKKPPIGLLVVGAAGNEDSMARAYPAAFTDAIAVGSTGSTGAKSSFSNFGPWVDVSAPGGDLAIGGVDIESTVPGPEGTGGKQGTSMAAPVVAGVAGLILSVDPGRSHGDLRSSIINTADARIYDVGIGYNRSSYFPKIKGDPVRRPLLGSGIVDAAAAIDGKEKTGVLGSSIGRVNGSCGTVGAGGAGSAAWWLLVPLLGLFYPRSWSQRAGARPPATTGWRRPAWPRLSGLSRRRRQTGPRTTASITPSSAQGKAQAL